MDKWTLPTMNRRTDPGDNRVRSDTERTSFRLVFVPTPGFGTWRNGRYVIENLDNYADKRARHFAVKTTVEEVRFAAGVRVQYVHPERLDIASRSGVVHRVEVERVWTPPTRRDDGYDTTYVNVVITDDVGEDVRLRLEPQRGFQQEIDWLPVEAVDQARRVRPVRESSRSVRMDGFDWETGRVPKDAREALKMGLYLAWE